MEDPRNSHDYALWIDQKPYIVALADDSGLVVYRSVALDTSDDRYQEVSDFVLDNRMVLVDGKVYEAGAVPGMVSDVEWRHYQYGS